MPLKDTITLRKSLFQPIFIMSPDPIPTYVYKIVPTAPPEPFPAENPLSELDQTDGFVHLSTAVQVGLS
jgi:hypothetical protein